MNKRIRVRREVCVFEFMCWVARVPERDHRAAYVAHFDTWRQAMAHVEKVTR